MMFASSFQPQGEITAPIDAALLAKDSGIFVLSLQSLHYKEQTTRHHSGRG